MASSGVFLGARPPKLSSIDVRKGHWCPLPLPEGATVEAEKLYIFTVILATPGLTKTVITEALNLVFYSSCCKLRYSFSQQLI